MNIDFATPMAALFSVLQAGATFTPTASATQGSAVLTGVSSFGGLFEGLPVFGPGVVKGATIAALSPGSATITLSDPVGEASTDAAFKIGFLATSRRLKPWSEVKAQPFLGLRRIGFTSEVDHETLFTRVTLETEAWIYCNAGQDPDVAPDVALTALEQLVSQALAPDTDYGDPRCTLGGQVYWARVEGRGDSSPGDLGGQAISKMPIRVTLP